MAIRKDPKTYNLMPAFERAKMLQATYPQAFGQMVAASSYSDWLKAKGYNTKCQHFTVDRMGNFYCDMGKVLILCNSRCIDKTKQAT